MNSKFYNYLPSITMSTSSEVQWLISVKEVCSNLLSHSLRFLKMAHTVTLEMYSNKIATHGYNCVPNLQTCVAFN